jgi:hypothetical protein
MQFDDSKKLLKEAGFELIDYYYRPLGNPKHKQSYLAI